jgi:predicted porin
LGSTSIGLNSSLGLPVSNQNYTDTGWVNSVTYETPVFAGFSGSLQFSPKESSADGAGSSYTASLAYNNGPLSAMLVYVDGGATAASFPAYPGEYKAINFGASYDFGVVKAFGQYTTFKYDDAPFLASFEKADALQIGVSVPVSAAGSILASYGQAKWKDSALDEDAKSRIFSVGYNHFISKRTDVYAAFTSEKLTDLKGGRTFAVGVKHAF